MDMDKAIPSEKLTLFGAASVAPTPRDVVFALGVPLLVAAAVPEARARSMLALVSKLHGEPAVVNALHECANDRPVEPVAWLQAKLGPTINGHSKSDRIARHNAEVLRRSLAESEGDAT
jgi:hypothetical protein